MLRIVQVAGAACYIGAVLSQRLLQRVEWVVDFDNLNDYGDSRFKQGRPHHIEAAALSLTPLFESGKIANFLCKINTTILINRRQDDC